MSKSSCSQVKSPMLEGMEKNNLSQWWSYLDVFILQTGLIGRTLLIYTDGKCSNKTFDEISPSPAMQETNFHK